MPETLGRYELIADIGRGGMADVKLAIQRGPSGFEKLVALKLVHEELASDKTVIGMLLDEAKLSAQIKHPNVVDVYELGEADGKNFIAMEYLEGEPLLAVLDKGATTGKRLDALSMARVVADAAEGLDAAHQLKSRDGKPLGLVHHDISLGNIFVLYSGQVKLLDFGIARRLSAARKVKQTDKVFGKLAYMAPEKLDERPGDKRSDIWSLGCVLWEALTAKRLFKGANDIELIREVRYVNVQPPSALNPDVPAELDPIVLKALQRDPFRRYQTAKEMGAAIEEVLTAKAYPSKNFKIGTYMMQAFAEHIAKRERLLREVAGPHRPSQEVIEAAFAPERDKRDGSLPSFDHLLDPSSPIVLPEGSTGADLAIAMPGAAAPISAVVQVPDTLSTSSGVMEVEGAPPPQSANVAVNPFEDDEVAATVYDVVPANAEASRTPRREVDASWTRSKNAKGLEELQRKAQELREYPDAVRRRQYLRYAAAIGGALVIVLIVVIAKSCGNSDEKKVAPVAAQTDPPVVTDAGRGWVGDAGNVRRDAPGLAVAADAAADVAVVTPDAAEIETAVVDEEIEMVPEEAVRPEEKPEKPRPKPTKSAQQYYAEGLAAWKKKDTKTAYARFTEGRRASSTYANNWYGLGLVHEKAGRKRDARTAYERYLKLAPKAPNNAKLRDHIRKNLM